MPELKLSATSANELKTEVLVMAIAAEKEAGKLSDLVKIANLGKKGGDTITLVSPKGFAADRVIVSRITDGNVRRAVASGVRAAGKAKTIGIVAPLHSDHDVETISIAALLAGYSFDKYKTDAKPGTKSITVLVEGARSMNSVKKSAQSIATAVATTRDWVNTPPGDLPPIEFVKEATKRAKEAGIAVTVWDEAKLAREKCGGILGVGAGSSNPPRLIKLSYKPRGAKKHIALVGKGITFDSGGLSLKPGAAMMTMKCDMAGAAAVVNATVAIAELGLPIQVTAYAALAENLPSGTATRPGDVLSIRNGKTVEVMNTDAEGRLVLADALSLAAESDADQIIDVATLTGACVVALGTRTAGLFSPSTDMVDGILAAAKRASEKFWHMPITEELLDRTVDTPMADIRQHNPVPHGGAVFAAAFLSRFVGDKEWAHLDIAGPAFNEESAYDDVTVGGTGVAVRTLVNYVRNM